MDYGARYPEAIPLRKTDSRTALMTMGFPKEVLSDNGSNRTGKLITELFTILQIEQMKTSPYHWDGGTLPLHNEVDAMIPKFDNQWDKALPYILLEVPNETTGFSPFELMYGRPARGPLDLLRESWESDQTNDEKVVQYVQRVQQRLESVKKALTITEK